MKVELINKLKYLQRVFTLKILKAYKNTNTNAPDVMIGIPPLHLVIVNNYKKFQFWKLSNYNLIDYMCDENIDKNVLVGNIDARYRSLDIKSGVIKDAYDVYTSGSKLNGMVGLSVCIFRGDDLFKVFQYKMLGYKTVFQAEITGIYFCS